MTNKFIKTGVFCAGSAAAALGISALAPQQALAAGWTPESMMQNAGRDGGVQVNEITAQQVNSWVVTITSWLVGIAVVIFVLRIVLTAIDRMVLGNGGSAGGRPGGPGGGGGDGFRLSDIPLIGAYPEDKNWKEIWKNFAVQLAIVAGAWLIVQLLMGIILWVFSGLTSMSS